MGEFSSRLLRVRMSLKSFVLLAAAVALTRGESVQEGCNVTQLHISPGPPVHSSLWVSWVTAENCSSVVEVENESEDDGNGARRVESNNTATRYAYDGSCITEYAEPHSTIEDNCPYESAFLHHVLLINLSPQTTYAYRAGGRFRGDGRSEVFSATRRFTTQKLPGVVDNEPVRFAVVGDLGQTAFSEKTMAEVNASRFEPMFLLETDKATYSSSAAAESQLPEPSLLMLVGDLSYADGDGRRWDRWGELFSPLLSELPLVAFPGNHEIEFDATRNVSFPHWRNRFRMPSVAPEVLNDGSGQDSPDRIVDYHSYDFDFTYEYGASYFSFEVGGVHAVCLNAYVHSEEGSAQYEWLRTDLEAVDRNATPWVLAFTHGPWYNSNGVHQGEVATLAAKAGLEPLLHAYGAAAVFAGHVHAYERTHPISPANSVDGRRNRRRRTRRRLKVGGNSGPVPVQNGVRDDAHGAVYVTIGDGGNREGLYDKWITVDDDAFAADDDANGDGGGGRAPEGVSFRNGSHYGRGDLVVVNATHLRWQWWPNGASVAEDEAWITNPYYRRDITGGGSSDNEPWWLAALLRCSFFWAMVLLVWGSAIGGGFAVWKRRGVRFTAIRSSAEPSGVGVGSVGGGEAEEELGELGARGKKGRKNTTRAGRGSYDDDDDDDEEEEEEGFCNSGFVRSPLEHPSSDDDEEEERRG